MKRRIALIFVIGVFIIGYEQMAIDKSEARGHIHPARAAGFMAEAFSGNMVEVQLGQIAQEKAQSQDVKDFGMRMVKDYGSANDELKRIARGMNARFSTTLKPKHKEILDKLSRISSAEFDKQYMRQMVRDHAEDMSAFSKAVQEVKDPDLNGWTKKTLEVIEQHFQQAKTIAKKLGVDTDQAEQEGRSELEKKENPEK